MTQVPQSQPINVGSNPIKNFKAIFQKNKNVLFTILIVFAALLLVKQVFFKPAVISVVGTGRLTAKPAQVEMLVTQVDSNPDPVVAVSNGENSIDKLVTNAKNIAGDDVEIQKSFYQVTPSVVSGDVLYQVVNVFKITANDPSLASDLIKMFYSQGATTVSNVNFIPENQDEVTQEARKAAIKEAKKEAKDIARASGKRLGRIVSIGDDLIDANSTVSTDGAAEGEEAAQVNYTNGVPSEIDIAKSMTVTYQIW